MHKNKEAEGIFRKILTINSQIYEAKWGLAEILRRGHKLQESEGMLNETIKANPDFASAIITLAYVKYTQLEFQECIKLALKVIRQGEDKVDLSNYTRAYLLFGGDKGMLASRGGPLSKIINGTAVLSNLKKAERLQPDSAAVLFGLGSFYFLAPVIIGGNINKAMDYLERAIKTDSLFADAYVRLSQVYLMKGDKAKYERYFNKALEIDPDNELAWDFKTKKCNFNCITIKE